MEKTPTTRWNRKYRARELSWIFVYIKPVEEIYQQKKNRQHNALEY